jgi:tetratricopeptide (TPR) repeat protein
VRKTSGPKWLFSAHFRRNVYGWRSSSLAVQRVKEAVGEIKRAAWQDPISGGEGAVLFLEKISPALEHVDSSSGAIGNAVYQTIEDLVPIIVAAPADDRLRDRWLRRLETAIQADDIPYLELLPDYWGELCVTAERASRWADEFIGIVRLSWGPDPEMRGFFKFTTACLSALLRAGRYEELLSLLEQEPHKMWHYRKWGVKALWDMGNKAEALRYAENSGALNDNPMAIARACEEILLSSGMVEEAYRRYALLANQSTTYINTFRVLVRKYPHKKREEILQDLINSTPGNEGKWFAAAKSAGLYETAIELANRSPCDPRTLTRAALDTVGKDAGFALQSGLAALRWLIEGYGYDVTSLDVRKAFEVTLQAADLAGRRDETMKRIRQLVAHGGAGAKFVAEALGSLPG